MARSREKNLTLNAGDDKFKLKPIRNSSNLCGICLTVMKREQLDQHLCMNQANIACEYCTDTFTSNMALCQHLSNGPHQNIALHKCSKCTLAFPMRKLLEIHEYAEQTQSTETQNSSNDPPTKKCK